MIWTSMVYCKKMKDDIYQDLKGLIPWLLKMYLEKSSILIALFNGIRLQQVRWM